MSKGTAMVKESRSGWWLCLGVVYGALIGNALGMLSTRLFGTRWHQGIVYVSTLSLVGIGVGLVVGLVVDIVAKPRPALAKWAVLIFVLLLFTYMLVLPAFQMPSRSPYTELCQSSPNRVAGKVSLPGPHTT